MPIPQLIDSLAHCSSSLPPLVSRPDTPCALDRRTRSLSHATSSCSRTGTRARPYPYYGLLLLPALSSDISRSPPLLIRLCPFSLKDFAGGSHWPENYLPPHHTRPPRHLFLKTLTDIFSSPSSIIRSPQHSKNPSRCTKTPGGPSLVTSPLSLKRKYSETIDLVEDDAEEPDPNDVSAEEVSALARISEVETGHQTETKKDYEGVSLSLRNIVQLPLVLFHFIPSILSQTPLPTPIKTYTPVWTYPEPLPFENPFPLNERTRIFGLRLRRRGLRRKLLLFFRRIFSR